MLDLIYTDADGKEQGVLDGYALAMTYGEIENTFDIMFASKSAPALAKGSMIYAEGTEYGGIVGGEKSSTTNATTTFYGPTWHGLLNERILRPPAGKTHFEYEGDANGFLRAVIAALGLSKWFSVEKGDAGRSVTCKARFEYAYDAICSALAASSLRLSISWRRDHAMLSAVPTRQWSNTNSSNAEFEVDRLLRAPNHAILLGKGEMLDRTVIDIYLDENGNVSDRQYFLGIDEVTIKYEDPSAEAEELLARGTEHLLGMQLPDAIDVTSEIIDDCAVGDFVTVANLESSQVATAPVSSKTVTIMNGVAVFSCDLGDVTSAGSRMGASSSGGKASGYVYRAGSGIVIEGATINAEVTGEQFKDLKTEVDGKAEQKHTHQKSEITDFAHTHPKSEITDFAHTHEKSEITDFEHRHDWSDIDDKPATYPPSDHSHDNRYYTETEVDDKLADKADASHRHDASEIEGLPSGSGGVDGIVPVSLGGTGVDNAAESSNSLLVKSLIGGHVDIPANADLNTYTYIGNRRCRSNATAATLKNCPTSVAFTLTVSSGQGDYANQTSGYLIQSLCNLYAQRWIRYSNDTGKTWSAWAREYDSTQTIPIANGGTGKTSADGINSVLFSKNEKLGGVFGYTTGWTGGYRTLANLRGDMGLGYTSAALPVANGGTGSTTGRLQATFAGGSWVSTGTTPTNAAINVTTKMNADSAWPIVNVTCSDNSHMVWDALGKSFYWGRTLAGQTENSINDPMSYNTETHVLYANKHQGTWDGNVITIEKGGTSSTTKYTARINLEVEYRINSNNGTGRITTIKTPADKSYLHCDLWDADSYGITWWHSDRRDKESIEPSAVSGLGVICSIEHMAFDMKKSGSHYDVGYIAQQLEEIDPNLVLKVPRFRNVDGVDVFTGDYTYQVDERTVIPYATKAIQELKEKVDSQQSEIDELKTQLAEIKSLLKGE